MNKEYIDKQFEFSGARKYLFYIYGALQLISAISIIFLLIMVKIGSTEWRSIFDMLLSGTDSEVTATFIPPFIWLYAIWKYYKWRTDRQLSKNNNKFPENAFFWVFGVEVYSFVSTVILADYDLLNVVIGTITFLIAMYLIYPISIKGKLIT